MRVMASHARIPRRSPSIRSSVAVAVGIALLAAPPAAHAATITADPAGTLLVGGSPAADSVTLARIDDATLRVVDRASPMAVDPAATACTLDVDGSARCSVSATSSVAIELGDGVDRLDATAAGSLELTVDGGGAADQLRVGSAGRVRLIDTGATDVVDLAHAEESVTVRWSKADARLLARCDGCATPWQVLLPARPGRVLLGGYADDVDLRAWSGVGRTTWLLGDDRDRYLGSPTRRAVVEAGDGWDTIISYAAVDVLRGGPGFDKLVDFGGRGDLLLGGPETDALSSLDGRRDTVDGQGGRDMCLTIRMTARGCDSGPVRSMETTLYHPLTAPVRVLRSLGIVL